MTMTATSQNTHHDWLGLAGKVCVVNGAASGIGAAIATALAERGAHVALLDRNAQGCETLQQALSHLPGRRFSVSCDIADEHQVKAAANAVFREFGACEALVNAAGILRSVNLADIELADWNTLLSVNLNGYLLCAREFGRQMRHAGAGSIVHISSIAAHHPQPYSGAYTPSKAAVSALSQQLAVEWGPHGVRSNCVAPGMIRTALTAAYYDHPGITEAREGFTATRRIGTPEDIANAVLFLLSERASYITGSEVAVNGGLSCMLMGKIPRPGFSASAD
ncbi:SDR family oxidoreductase [Pseudomonas sp. dw_612]|uniref:SDR family NAD(P)-dependent oxidoreductase n=1 Tax=Pseudomonas sp. dw_612 TaxID=2720080 RepID=UPI002116A5F9|nr:SDR family oxidoreductase [Pseudomonas sp. dw_612]